MKTRLAAFVVLLFAIALGRNVAHSATIIWTNSASGGWNNAANWNPNAVPGAGDTAIITNAGVAVSLNGATTVGAIILGTSGAGTVTLALNNQTLILNGPLTVNPSGSFTVDSGALVGNTNAVLNGTIGWSAAVLGGNLTLASGSTLKITTGNNHDLPNCILTNNGMVAWSGGAIRGGGPGTFVYNNGVWDAQGDQTFNNAFGGAGAVFNNAGTFGKSASAGGSTVFSSGVIFNNAGKLDSQTNFIYLNGGGSFTGGTATNLTGFVGLNQGAFNLNGTVTSSNVQMLGDATLTGNNVINGALNWIAGQWNNSASETIATNSTLYITGANNHNLANCTLTNHGTVVWSDGALRVGGSPGTLIYNHGLWDAQSDQALNNAYGGDGAVFNNFGTFRKSGGADSGQTLLSGGVFLNQFAGALDVRQGNLVLQGSGNLAGGTATNNAGTLVLSLGNFNINGTVTGSNVVENAANLIGTNVINGGLNWVQGAWNGAVVTIASNSTVVISGGGQNNDLSNCTVTNYGVVTWSSGILRGGATPGTAVYNYGLWDAQSDRTFNNGYGGSGTVFNNLGTLRKSGGTNTGQTLIGGGVFLNQLAGALDVRQGNLVLQGSGNLAGGTATNNAGTLVLSLGNFKINGTVTGSNVVENAANLIGTNVINGGLNWVQGAWNGAVVTIASNSTVVISGGGQNNDLSNCTVTNYGVVTWSSGILRGGATPGTAVYNYGLWDAQSDRTFNNGYGGSGTVFNNFGTFRKSAGTDGGQTLLGGNVLLNQFSGALDVQDGNLVLQGGGNFTGGTANNPAGAIYLSIGNFNINGTVTGNVIENSGNLVGVNVIHGGLNWVQGAWNGAVVTIASNSTVVIAGGGQNNDLASGTVTNYGVVIWASGSLRGGSTPGTAVYNYGLWDAQSDGVFNNGFGGSGTVFNNFGTFRKEFTTGTTALQVPFNNTGRLDAQDGRIALQAAYTLANGTQMSFGLGGWIGNGSISLSGPASFKGSLGVNLNGFFWPGVGSSFDLLNYTSESGVLFTNTALPAAFTWQTNYNPTAFALSVVARPAFTNTASTNLFISNLNQTNLYLAWPGDHTGWQLQAQTNPLAVGLSTNWFAVSDSSLTNEIFMPIDATKPTVFFRMIYP